MPFLFSGKSTGNLFTVSQPPLSSSDRTAHLKSKTKYAAATNLAQNGGTLMKKNGSKYMGPVRTNCSSLTSTDSYADLLDITKGKYLLTPPPSSDLDNSFSPENGEVYYGNFAVTDYSKAGVPVNMLGFPTINITGLPPMYTYAYPDQLVATSSGPVPIFNNSNIVIDPEYRMFYKNGTCNNRNYFKNVYLDPNVDVTWKTTSASGIGGEIFSSRPYNQQQAQRIIANQAQSLRGFQYPTQVHFSLDNCESKPSITPTAPDAPVIYITEVVASTTTPGLYEVTITWLYGFDGGSPITYYTVSINKTQYQVAPKPCINTFTTTIPCGQEIWVSATNCVPDEKYQIISPLPHCTELTSEISNKVMVNCTNTGALPIPEVIIANHSEESGGDGTGGVGLLIGFPSEYSAVDSVSIANGGATYSISGTPTLTGYYVFYENAYPSPGFWPDLGSNAYANVVQVQQNGPLCGGVAFGASITITYHLSTSPAGVYNTVLYKPPEPPQLDVTDGYQYQQYNGGYAVAGPFAWNETWDVQVGTGTQTYAQWQSSGSPGIYKYLYPHTAYPAVLSWPSTAPSLSVSGAGASGSAVWSSPGTITFTSNGAGNILGIPFPNSNSSGLITLSVDASVFTGGASPASGQPNMGTFDLNTFTNTGATSVTVTATQAAVPPYASGSITLTINILIIPSLSWPLTAPSLSVSGAGVGGSATWSPGTIAFTSNGAGNIIGIPFPNSTSSGPVSLSVDANIFTGGASPTSGQPNTGTFDLNTFTNTGATSVTVTATQAAAPPYVSGSITLTVNIQTVIYRFTPYDTLTSSAGDPPTFNGDFTKLVFSQIYMTQGKNALISGGLISPIYDSTKPFFLYFFSSPQWLNTLVVRTVEFQANSGYNPTSLDFSQAIVTDGYPNYNVLTGSNLNWTNATGTYYVIWSQFDVQTQSGGNQSMMMVISNNSQSMTNIPVYPYPSPNPPDPNSNNPWWWAGTINASI